MSGYLLWPSEAVKVTKGEALLGRYAKTEMSDRQFCTRCGGHIMSRHPGMGLTDVRPAVMPDVAFRPTVHLHYAGAGLSRG